MILRHTSLLDQRNSKKHMKEQKPKIVAVAGPTGAGKSRLAAAIAASVGGEVVSCDSMQIYRGMDIGTGKVTEEEKAGVPHHLLDISDVSKDFSLADFLDLARRTINGILARGKTPVLCGGTGLYLDRLTDGTDLSLAPSDEHLRGELEKLDSASLHAKLEEIDPESAGQIHENNRKRVIRALEIALSTGVSKTEWDARSKRPSPYDRRLILLLPEDRQALYDAIDRRVDLMFAQGLAEEARRVLSSSPSRTAAQAIGYKEFKPYFDGVSTLSEVNGKIKQASRNYAKRQLTWFGKEEDALRLFFETPFEEQLRAALAYIENKEKGDRAAENG